MTPKTRIIARCPRCGSTAVGADEARSLIEFTYMHCTACGHGELVDAYERDEEWLVEIALPDDASEIPPEVPPPAPRRPAPHAENADPDATPARRDARSAARPGLEGLLGCASCLEAEAASAWQALSPRRLETLVDESHFSVSLARCTCGQHFAIVFLERVDWVGGEDDQTWLAVALRDGEVEALRASPESAVENRLHTLAHGRRCLVRHFPTGGELTIAWRERAFAIGPHD